MTIAAHLHRRLPLTFAFVFPYCNVRQHLLMMIHAINEWVKNWGGLLGLLLGTGVLIAAFQFAVNYGTVAEQLRAHNENIAKIPGIENKLSLHEPYLAKLPVIQEQTSKVPLIERKLFTLGRSMDRDVIPNLNILLEDKKLPKVQPVKIEEIAALLEKDGAKWQPTLLQTARETKAAVSTLTEDFWKVGDQILQPRVEETAADEKKSLMLAWTEEKERRIERARSAPQLPGQAFNPGSVPLPFMPELRASVKNGTIFLEGVVPDAEAKSGIEQAFRRLQPKHLENKLKINRW